MDRGILDVLELANYIAYKHKEKTGNDISPLKLQKSLYFLFAYWGGFVRKGKQNPGSVEQNMTDFDEYLFDAEFLAWAYGPVEYRVYNMYRIECIDKKSIKNVELKLNEIYDRTLYNFIIKLLNDLIDANEFDLIDISKKDIVWKSKYNINKKTNYNLMDNDEIIDEYIDK